MLWMLLSRLRRAGYLAIVMTNQPDVGNGFTSPQRVEAMHNIMRRQLASIQMPTVAAAASRSPA